MSVYFVQAGEAGPVKIGWAINAQSRVAYLQTAHYEPLRVIRVWDGDRIHENWFHNRFRTQRMRGEWFRFSQEMLTAEPQTPIGKVVDFGDVITLWPSLKAFNQEVGVTECVARQWLKRRSIPARYWQATVRAAEARGFSEVTTDRLAKIARFRAERSESITDVPPKGFDNDR